MNSARTENYSATTTTRGMPKTYSTCVICVAIVLNLAVSKSASADDIFSVQSGPWNAAATWSTGTVPTAADNVTIKTSHIVTTPSDQPQVCNDLDIETDALLTLSKTTGLRVTGSLVNDGSVNSDDATLPAFIVMRGTDRMLSVGEAGFFDNIELLIEGTITVTTDLEIGTITVKASSGGPNGKLTFAPDVTLVIREHSEIVVWDGAEIVFQAGDVIKMSDRTGIALDTDPFNPNDRGGRFTARGTACRPVLLEANAAGNKYIITVEGDWDTDQLDIRDWQDDLFNFGKNAAILRMRNTTLGPSDPARTMVIFDGISATLERTFFLDQLAPGDCNIKVIGGANITLVDYGGPAAGPSFECEENGTVAWSGRSDFELTCIVPTMSTWGIVSLIAALLTYVVIRFRRSVQVR